MVASRFNFRRSVLAEVQTVVQKPQLKQWLIRLYLDGCIKASVLTVVYRAIIRR